MNKANNFIRRLYKIAVIFDKKEKRIASVKFALDAFKITWEVVQEWRNKH